MVRYNEKVDTERYPELLYFARNVQAARAYLKLSQGQFAELVKMTQPYISALEGFKANPTLQVVSHISQALGVTGAQMLEPSPPKFPKKPPGASG